MLHKLGTYQQKNRRFAPSTQLGNINDRYAFVLDYFDPQADLIRKYQLLFYGFDDTIEIYDMKTKKIFLKRSPIKGKTLEDFYVGAKVSIYSRLMTVISYGDEYTKKKFSKFTQKTLGLIKPDGIANMGNIIDRIYKEDLRISHLKKVHLSESQAKQFYEVHKHRPFFKDLIPYITSGPIVAMELVGPNAISTWRKLIGPTDPGVALQTDPNSLRALYGSSKTKNCSHGSDAIETAEIESNFFFPNEKSKKTSIPQKFDNCLNQTNSTLCIVKPNSIKNSGKIVQRIIDEGYEIGAMEMFTLQKQDTIDFLEVYKGVVPEYTGLVDDLSSGPILAIEVYAPIEKELGNEKETSVVDPFRELCGPHDPQLAKLLRPNSIRAIFGKNKIQNAVHCTDLVQDGPLEVEFFFQILQDME